MSDVEVIVPSEPVVVLDHSFHEMIKLLQGMTDGQKIVTIAHQTDTLTTYAWAELMEQFGCSPTLYLHVRTYMFVHRTFGLFSYISG
jgi:hypothetical protein